MSLLENISTMKPSDSGKNTSYVDMPDGIMTEDGTLFHTTEQQLRAYAGELLKHISLSLLLKRATVWLRFPQNIAITLAPIFLLYIDVPLAIGLVIGVFVLMSIFGPAIVSHNMFFLAKGFDTVAIQALVYTVFLSYAGMSGNYLTFIIGLIIFVGFRWGGFQWLMRSFINWSRQKIYNVPYEDQMLKSVIVRASMKYRTDLSDLVEMEKAILNKINRWV